ARRVNAALEGGVGHPVTLGEPADGGRWACAARRACAARSDPANRPVVPGGVKPHGVPAGVTANRSETARLPTLAIPQVPMEERRPPGGPAADAGPRAEPSSPCPAASSDEPA